ncbi:hypothetical protein GGI02_004232 [Coemansia sp. RSA 2322]|uniref:Molybdopterin synthase sulfur carrier subunit n=1 Tax=Coemansia thaxteri TaxID=2663907 RepID=A0A9W8BHU2_9FUNG|nr:hypothetical protein H4R26_003573 [Coemansia thaxteri]KAJ2466858.1 hypothetical protein GGI02_004232 [Coemansia sp. RSA 2322]KAJ2482649.1 hypothetical protein EV174_003155 [Coemansia sp. RSA 2320]
MVEFKVLYFASARDAAHNIESETMELDDEKPATLASAVERIMAVHPEMKAVLEHAMVSLNEEYCEQDAMADVELKPKDTVAIIPPVSGG